MDVSNHRVEFGQDSAEPATVVQRLYRELVQSSMFNSSSLGDLVTSRLRGDEPERVPAKIQRRTKVESSIPGSSALDSNPRLLSISQAHRKFGIPLRSLYRLVETGSLPVIRIGKRKGWRIRPESIEQLIADREEFHSPAAPFPSRSTSRVSVSPEHQKLIEKHLLG